VYCHSMLSVLHRCVNSRWDRPKADVLPNESRGSISSSTDASGAPQGGVEMAAAMAAKINAMLMAKGKLKPLQPLPSKVLTELIVAEVDINDMHMECRDLLTKGKTQDEIGQLSGAVVSTKGLYMSDTDRSGSAGVARPLYLHVQGRCREQVNSKCWSSVSAAVLRRPIWCPRQEFSWCPSHRSQFHHRSFTQKLHSFDIKQMT
uniref:ATP-dependent RNA helicase PRP5/DDX46/KHDC4 KH domain-containing protein n=1 Tax=Sinocyclocheilus anshuiensis TaxID=1608454 RepID=A0A671SCD4_9TELE